MSNGVPLPGIQHVVVLMLENRSFDNVLGGLYPELTKKGLYRGLLGTETNPLDPSDPQRGSVQVFQGGACLSTWIMPYPDPGELYSDMVQQIFGQSSVPSGCVPAPMTGFAWNYSAQPWSIPGEGWPSVPPVPQNIMQYYSEQAMPTTYGLAKAFAVCDCWFAAAPCQTIANRVLAHCGTPGTLPDANMSRVDNTDYTEGYHGTNPPIGDTTIFQLLDGAYPEGKAPERVAPDAPRERLNWKVYYHDVPLSVLCRYVYEHWDYNWPYGGNVWWLYEYEDPWKTTFEYDVENNLLPKYSFIEPRYTNEEWGIPNSNHPGGAGLEIWNPNGESLPPPIDVREGERLLYLIYAILRKNLEVFKKTLLIVTYDEHGGLFDHVGPPCAKSPFRQPVQNFNYDRYGVRVPAILINPYITPGTLYPERTQPCPLPSPPFDHTSILSTLIAQFGLSSSLSPRVDQAPRLTGLISENYTAPPECVVPPLPAPLPPVARLPPPRSVKTVSQRPHPLAGALVPLYWFIRQSKRRPLW